jgi:uncharacterized protein YqgV (UPF0045/DUF77 family)
MRSEPVKIAVEISFYPLNSDFKPPIRDFITRLRDNPGLDVTSNRMSTMIVGDYDLVIDTLKLEMRPHLEGAYRVVFATKFMGPVAS